MKKEKKNKIQSFKNNLYLLKMVWEISKSRVIMTFLISLLDFASWTFYTVVFMRYLFGSDQVVRSFGQAATFIWIVAGINVFILLLFSWHEYRYVPLTDIKIHYALNRKLFEKASSVDISCYENPDFYDDYTRATTEAFDRAMSVLKNLSMIISALLSSIYVIYTMCSITVFAVIFIIFPILGNFVFGKKMSQLEFKLSQDNIPYKRRYDYVNRAVYLKSYSGQMRMTKLFDILKRMYGVAYDGILANTRRYAKRLAFNDIARNLLMYPLAFQGMWLAGAYLAIVTQTITKGDYIVLSSAIVSTTFMLFDFTNATMETYNNGLFIENLKNFMHYKPKINENQKGIILQEAVKTIKIENVFFRYDGQEQYTLKNINLTLYSGQKVAIVGLNGSGKTTLVKLIMRLYDPTEGRILLNGTDIREYDLHQYRMLIGTTFQDFSIFSTTVMENVLMHNKIDKNSRKQALEALKESGAYEKVNTLSKGLETTLTREFDDEGVELSGGEYQKIAVARAFAKASPIVILDEPSSALDPVAEYNMYETILKLCDKIDPNKGKISIIISHRLSSASLSDHIYVLDNGEVVEDGNHQTLMKHKGKYAAMFLKQAENYLLQEEEVVL